MTIKGKLKKKDKTIKSLPSKIKVFEKQVKKLKVNVIKNPQKQRNTRIYFPNGTIQKFN